MNFSQIARTFSLKGRVAIVTDATNGIGRATALYLASRGASISLVYPSGSVFGSVFGSLKAHCLTSEINYSGSSASIPRAILIRADLSNPEDVSSVFNRTEETFKCRPHIIFHSASVFDEDNDLFSSSISRFKFYSIMSANTRKAFLVLREAANRVAQDGGGRILAVSSLASRLVERNVVGYGAYAASKAAVEAMIKTLANELREKGMRITANCIAPWPGPMDMFFPWKMEEDEKTEAAPDNIEDLESVLRFLCSDEGELVNGEVIKVKDT